MKKQIGAALALIVSISLLAGCGSSKTPQNNPASTPASTPATTQTTGGSDTSNKPAETGSGTELPEVNPSGTIEYNADELLKSFSDYIAAQDMSETEAVRTALDMEKGEMKVRMALSSALIDANRCVFTAMYDDFMNSGKTLAGSPVTKQVNGDEVTWDVEKTVEVREGQNSQVGDVMKAHILLNTKTNTLMSEEVTMRGAQIIEKKVNKVVALPDGTVMSELYTAGPSAKGDETVSSASVYRYNLKSGELECITGTFKTTTTDFSEPSCLTSDAIDRDAYLAFADPVGTVNVSGGTGEVIVP